MQLQLSQRFTDGAAATGGYRRGSTVWSSKWRQMFMPVLDGAVCEASGANRLPGGVC